MVRCPLCRIGAYCLLIHMKSEGLLDGGGEIYFDFICFARVVDIQVHC